MSSQPILLDGDAFQWDHLITDIVLRLRREGIQSVLWDRTAYGHYGVPIGFRVGSPIRSIHYFVLTY